MLWNENSVFGVIWDIIVPFNVIDLVCVALN